MTDRRYLLLWLATALAACTDPPVVEDAGPDADGVVDGDMADADAEVEADAEGPESECLIDGVSFAAGELDPEEPCRRCDPERSTTGWSEVEEGADCDDGLYCNGEDRCTAGRCVHGGNPCLDEAPAGTLTRCWEEEVEGRRCCAPRDERRCDEAGEFVVWLDSCGHVTAVIEDCATGPNRRCEASECRCAIGWSGPSCDRCVIHVDGAAGDDGSDGRSWAEALATVGAGIATAAELDCEVWVAAGTYVPGNHPDAAFVLVPGVDLYGGFSGTERQREERDFRAHETILSGDIGVVGVPEDNVNHVVIGADDVRLDGFTISGGYCRFLDILSGAGLLNRGTSPTVVNCTFRENILEPMLTNLPVLLGGGGAVFNQSSSAVYENCLFIGNSVVFSTEFTDRGHYEIMGGALFSDWRSNIGVHGSVFIDNIILLEVRGPLVSCLFPGMCLLEVMVGGAGMFCQPGGCSSVTSSLFWENSTVYTEDVDPNNLEIIQITFGALYAGDDRTSVRNSILWGNSLDVDGVVRDGVEAQVRPPQFAHPEHSNYVQGEAAASPGFVDAGSDDFTLAEESPCVNAGDGEGLPADVADLDGDGNRGEPAPLDLGGDLRLVEQLDIGPFERQDDSTPPVLEAAWGAGDRVEARFDDQLEAASVGETLGFELDGGAFVVDAVLHSDGRTALLTTTPLTRCTVYELIADGVENRFGLGAEASAATFDTAALLFEDFDDGDRDGWRFVELRDGWDEGWEVAQGRLIQRLNHHNLGGDSVDALREGPSAVWDAAAAHEWTDYRLEITLGSMDNDGIGVLLRYQDGDNHYRLDFDAERRFRALVRRRDGVEEILAATAVEPGYSPGQTGFELSVEMVGNVIHVEVEGAVLFDHVVDPAPLEAGTIGLWVMGNTDAFFDDLLVTDLTCE